MSNSNTIERVYRDERIEGIQVRNSGGSIFNIWTEGERPGYCNEDGWCNVDCFTRYPEGSEHTSESIEQAAIDYFNELADEWEVA